MPKGLSATHTIPAPAGAVFAVLADIDQVRQWQPSVQKVSSLTDGPMAKGSKWIETRMTPRGPFVSTIQVTELVPGKALALKADNKQAELSFRFDLEEAGGATKVSISSEGRLKGLRSIFSGKLVEQMKKEDADLLVRLERQVVANAARGAASSIGTASAKGGKGGKAAKAAKTTKANKTAAGAKVAGGAKAAKAAKSPKAKAASKAAGRKGKA